MKERSNGRIGGEKRKKTHCFEDLAGDCTAESESVMERCIAETTKRKGVFDERGKSSRLAFDGTFT